MLDKENDEIVIDRTRGPDFFRIRGSGRVPSQDSGFSHCFAAYFTKNKDFDFFYFEGFFASLGKLSFLTSGCSLVLPTRRMRLNLMEHRPPKLATSRQTDLHFMCSRRSCLYAYITYLKQGCFAPMSYRRATHCGCNWTNDNVVGRSIKSLVIVTALDCTENAQSGAYTQVPWAQ